MILVQVRGLMAGIGLVLFSFVWLAKAQAEVTVSPQMMGLIEAAAAKSYVVYPVDKEKHDALLRLVDQWAQLQVPQDDAHRIKDKSSDRMTWVKEQTENAPIFLSGENRRGLSPKHPFRIKYVKKSEGRSFVKAIRMPSSHRLKEEEVVRIGRGFVEKQGFVAQTAADKIGGHLVVARLTEAIGADESKTNTLTVLQRAIFKRFLDGLVVFNSRQIVDIHPDTQEILAFKVLEWAPVRETDRKTVNARPAKKLLSAIKEEFRKTLPHYHVIAVEAGMYQSIDQVFPVLAVSVERSPEADEVPILRTLYLPLSDYAATPMRRIDLKLPQVAQ